MSLRGWVAFVALGIIWGAGTGGRAAWVWAAAGAASAAASIVEMRILRIVPALSLLSLGRRVEHCAPRLKAGKEKAGAQEAGRRP